MGVPDLEMDPEPSKSEVCPDEARSGRIDRAESEGCFDRMESDRPDSDGCYWVYVLQSIPYPEHFYTGFTKDVPNRIQVHNRKAACFSKRFAPWKLRAQIGFVEKEQAMAFERYLKTGSGRAFAKMHL